MSEGNENKLLETINSLESFGMISSIATLVDELITAVNYGNSILTKNDFSISATNKKEGAGNSRNLKDSISGYDENWNLKQKYLFILERENRFLHFKEAAQILINLEEKGDVKKVQSTLTTSTRPLKVKKIIVKVIVGGSSAHTFWGKPEWLNSKGDPKNEYMYNKNVLNEIGGAVKSSSLKI